MNNNEKQNNINSEHDMIPGFDSIPTVPPGFVPQPSPEINPQDSPKSSPEIGPEIPTETFPEMPSPETQTNRYNASVQCGNDCPRKFGDDKYLSRNSAIYLGVFLIASSAIIGFCSGMFGATYSSPSYENSRISNSQAPAPITPSNTAPASKPVTQKSTVMNPTTSQPSLIQIAESAKYSVVEIATETMKTDSSLHQYISAGAGSGVIISEDGYIFTNNHVIAGANKITVTLRSNEKYSANIVGKDAALDIALLKIDKSGLSPATLGDSDGVSVGETIIAVGNPLGQLGGTVTDGIISALNRDITINNETMNLLQTNAAINPGNSGGGIFNMNGELIGIVVAKTKAANTEGLGFAIPINDVKSVKDDLLQSGYVKGRASLGVTVVNGESLKGGGSGVVITKVNQGSSAEEVDLKHGDRIISVNSKTVRNIADLQQILKGLSPGTTVPIGFMRGKDTLTVNLVLSESTS